MNAMAPTRGGAPVGFVTELPPVEASAVLYLRLWHDGPEGQTQVWEDFSLALGADRGRAALQSFEALCDLCIQFGRRPLMRHHVACKCLGADESCFATFVGYACDGAREDALLMATTLVRADMAPALVGLAQDFGLALRLMARRAARPAGPPATFH